MTIVIHSFVSWQVIMPHDSIVLLYQNRASLKRYLVSQLSPEFSAICLVFDPRYIWSWGGLKIKRRIQNCVEIISLCGLWLANCPQKDSIEALYQTWDPLIQKLVSRDLSKFAEMLLQDHQGGNEMVLDMPKVWRNWFKDVTSTRCDIFLLFACGCRLCCCTCLKSRSVNVWLGQWTCDSHVPARLAALPRNKRDAVWSFPVSLE